MGKPPRTHIVVWSSPQLVYLRVPKAANTSIRRSLPDGESRRVDISRLARLYPEHLAFSFVRNPWARLVSVYVQKILHEELTNRFYLHGVHRGFTALGLPMRACMSFEAFAEIACALPDEKTEKHLKSQCHFLVRGGQLVPGFLGRVETMGRDWSRLAARAGFQDEVPHLNHTPKPSYLKFYDTRLVQLVGDRYREDVERFAYDFGEPTPRPLPFPAADADAAPSQAAAQSAAAG